MSGLWFDHSVSEHLEEHEPYTVLPAPQELRDTVRALALVAVAMLLYGIAEWAVLSRTDAQWPPQGLVGREFPASYPSGPETPAIPRR